MNGYPKKKLRFTPYADFMAQVFWFNRHKLLIINNFLSFCKVQKAYFK